MAARPATVTAPSPEMTGYDSDVRFYATRYTQGGRVVFSLDLSLAQVGTLIPKPDPAKLTPGNRAIRANHAADFGRYLRTRPDWVAPSIILRAPNIFNFNVQTEIEGTEFGVISFPLLAGADINILDGQHRILGIHLANEAIAEDIDKARSLKAAARRSNDEIGEREAEARIRDLEKQRDRLSKERVNIQIHVVEDPVAYKQMFFDIADNALGITSSVKARFDNRKVVNRSLEQVLEHPLLVGRVDPERDRLQNGAPYLLSAKHVAEIIRTVNVGIDGRVSRRQEAELNENQVADRTKAYLDALVTAFPELKAVADGALAPADLRKTSLLGSVLLLRILGGVWFDLVTDREWSADAVIDFFTQLAPHTAGPVYAGSIWTNHTDTFDDNAMAPRGRRQDIAGTTAFLTEWGITKPAWLNTAPAKRPAP